MAYTSQKQVENYLGRQLTSSEQGIMPTLIDGAKLYIDDQTGQTFEPLKDYDGNVVTSWRVDGGVQEIFLPFPVKTISTINYLNQDGTVNGSANTTDYTAYPINSPYKTSLLFNYGFWPYGIGNIQIVGSFGFAKAPADIQTAATILVADLIRNPEHLTSETIEGYAREFGDLQDPKVAQIIENNRRVMI